MAERGRLYLVVGASGVGKDSIIAGLKRRLQRDRHYLFPRRYITREPEHDSENHWMLSESGFLHCERCNQFMLSWRAHGLRYGIGRELETALCNGHHVIINVSRSVIDHARTYYAPIRVLAISASTETLRQRLIARARESHFDIEQRIARAAAFEVHGDDVITIRNDSSLDNAIARAFDAVIGASPMG